MSYPPIVITLNYTASRAHRQSRMNNISVNQEGGGNIFAELLFYVCFNSVEGIRAPISRKRK